MRTRSISARWWAVTALATIFALAPGMRLRTGGEGELIKGGILRTHAGEDLLNFDFTTQTTVRTQQRVGGSYNRPLRYSFFDEGEVVPDLTENWAISTDGLEYSFNLRPGVKFRCGSIAGGGPGACTDLDAADVKHSFDKYRDPSSSRRAGYFTAVDRIEVVDSLTPKFVLTQPDADFLSKVAVGWFSIIPSEISCEEVKTTVIGTGPFIWEEYVTGQGSSTVANPDYHREGLPYIDGVRNFVLRTR